MENKPQTSFHHFHHFYNDQTEPSQNTIIATECEPVTVIEIHPVALSNTSYSVSSSNYIVVDDIETCVFPPQPVVHQPSKEECCVCGPPKEDYCVCDPPKEDCCVCDPPSYETIIYFGKCCRCCLITFILFMFVVVIWSFSSKP
jgi:hypothetical protein